MGFNRQFTLLVILAVIIIVPSLLPLFRADFFHMHDYTHVARLYEMDKAIKDGHFPVRWSKDLGWGYGMPMFNFYAPFPYYLGELFHLIGLSFLNSLKVVFGLTFFIAFAGMFLLTKKFWGFWGAFLSAIAFVYSPYRSVDFYVRGALGELFAISLIPWALWAMFELIEKQKVKYLVIPALILSVLFSSHTVLTLICLPFILLIGFFYVLINKHKARGILFSCGAFFWSLALAAYFLLPAFLEKQFTRVDQLTQGFSYYGHHFLYWRQFLEGIWGYGGSVDSIPDGLSFHLGKPHLLLALVSLIAALVVIIRKRRFSLRGILTILFSVLALFLAFLTTYHAKSIWDFIPLMAYIQFPWRFNSLIIVLIGFLAGGGCFYLQKWLGQKAGIIFFLASTLIIVQVNLKYFRPEGYIEPEGLYYTDETRIKKEMSGIIPDYISRWVKDIPPANMANKDYQVINGTPQIEVIESKTQKTVLKISTENKVSLLLNRFYFPGWEAFINKDKINLNYKESNGIISVDLPAGNYVFTLQFKDTPIRSLANTLSLTSLFLVGGVIVFRRKIS